MVRDEFCLVSLMRWSLVRLGLELAEQESQFQPPLPIITLMMNETKLFLTQSSMNTTQPSALPSAGRLAGIDFGTVRIGISISDPTQQFVTPYETYRRRTERLDSLYFSDFCRQEQIVGWVIGLPVHCDGKESSKSIEVREFAKWLANLSSVPYAFYDERFSSKEARVLMYDTGWSPKQKKKNVDRLAAYLILSHFLEAKKHDQASVPFTSLE